MCVASSDLRPDERTVAKEWRGASMSAESKRLGVVLPLAAAAHWKVAARIWT